MKLGQWGVTLWKGGVFPNMEAIKSNLPLEPETTVPVIFTSGGNEEYLLKLLLMEFKVE